MPINTDNLPGVPFLEYCELAASGDTAAYHASIKAAEVSARLASKRYARPKAIPDLSESPLFGGAKQLNLLGEEI